MSVLRPSIAGRLLRAGAPSARRAVPGTVRFETTTALGTALTKSETVGKTSALTREDPKHAQPRHNQPDYDAEVDQASS
jgi:NADH dehydrogenase (ubiquinone) Fe-S protein 4